MKLQPVRHYRTPGYPTRDCLAEHPELLRLVPERWRANRRVLAVLSTVAALLCARQASAADADAAAPAGKVAPLFIHGEGRGAFGCVAVNPPVFLSEDEARAVVRDEAAKAGITFAEAAPTLPRVTLPKTNRFAFLEEEAWADAKSKDTKAKPPRQKSRKGELELDGYDATRKVAFEVVTQDDFVSWESRDDWIGCTVSDYDIRDAATRLREGLAGTAVTPTIGVFYEPGGVPPSADAPKGKASETEWRSYYEKQRQAAKAAGAQELRQQVRDFLAWLKAEGII